MVLLLLHLAFDLLCGFDLGFVYQHDGDVVFYGVDSMTLGAFQALGILAVVEGFLAGWADEDVQQLFRNHGSIVRENCGTKSCCAVWLTRQAD
jgi:hypothetical protein